MNCTDGEGNCCCHAGTQAGIGRALGGPWGSTPWHRVGVPGCLFGPKESRGVSPDERRRRALAAYLTTVPAEHRQAAAHAFAAGWDACKSGK